MHFIEEKIYNTMQTFQVPSWLFFYASIITIVSLSKIFLKAKLMFS